MRGEGSRDIGLFEAPADDQFGQDRELWGFTVCSALGAIDNVDCIDKADKRTGYEGYAFMAEDHLSNAVSIEADLTETGVKAAARSRAIAALDRLVGNLIDWPSSLVEAKSRTVRLETELKEYATRERAKLRLQFENEFQSLEARAQLEAKTRAMQSEINRDSVAAHAVEDLRSTTDKGVDGQPQIDDDWMNEFVHLSGDASTSYAREMWGKVLSGQIKNPGAFSKPTLRKFSEIDQETAQIFVQFLENMLDGGFIFARNGALKGEELLRAIALETAGLVHGASSPLTLSFNENGNMEVRQFAGKFILIGMRNQPISYSVMRLTKSGLELAKIANISDGLSVLRSIADEIKGKCDSLKILKVISNVDAENIKVQDFELIK